MNLDEIKQLVEPIFHSFWFYLILAFVISAFVRQMNHNVKVADEEDYRRQIFGD